MTRTLSRLAVSFLLALLLAVPAASGVPAAQPIAMEPGNNDPGIATAGEPATFTTTFGGTKWVWDFGDGHQQVTDQPTASHAYATDGGYVTVVTARGPGAPNGTANRTFRQVDVGQVYSVSTSTQWVPVPSATIEGLGVGPAGEVRAAISRPLDAAGRTVVGPVVLECTAYRAGSTGTSNAARSLVKSGYVVVRVSTAGTNSSGGVFDFFGPQSRGACADVVSWAGQQEWSNGKVATVGISAAGILSLMTASEIASREAAGIDVGADYVGGIGDAVIGDFYRDLAYRGGIPNSQTFLNVWRGGLGILDFAQTMQDGKPQYAGQKLTAGAVDLASIYSNPNDNAYWDARDIPALTPPTDPMLLFATTGDIWPRSWDDLTDWIRPAGGRLIMPAGAHGANDASGFQPTNLLCRDTACASFEQDGSWKVGEGRLWLDELLMGIDRGVVDRPDYTVHLPDGGQRALQGNNGGWVTFEDYPLPGTRWDRWALREDGLVRTDDETPGGYAPLVFAPTGAAAETATLDGDTMVRIDSQPLTEDLTMIGPGNATLLVDVQQGDFPFVVRLLDVYPDGSAAVISRGYLKASHRMLDQERTEYDAAGRITRAFHPHDSIGVVSGMNTFEIEIEPVVNRFRAGHRLRFEVASQDLSEALAISANLLPGTARMQFGTSGLRLPLVAAEALTADVFPRPGAGWVE